MPSTVRLLLTAKDSASGVLGRITGGLGKFSLAGVGAIGVIGGIATGLAVGTKRYIDHADALAKMAQRTGVAVDDLSALEYAFGQADLTRDDLEKGLRRLNLRKPGETIDSIADKIVNLQTIQEQSAFAAEAFGTRLGPRMLTLLTAGSEGLDSYREKARELGIVISQETADGAATLNDRLEDLQTIGGSLLNNFFAKTIPPLSDLAVRLFPLAKEGAAAFSQGLSDLSGFAQGVADAVTNVGESIVTAVVNLRKFLGVVDEFGNITSAAERQQLVNQVATAPTDSDLGRLFTNVGRDELGSLDKVVDILLARRRRGAIRGLDDVLSSGSTSGGVANPNLVDQEATVRHTAAVARSSEAYVVVRRLIFDLASSTQELHQVQVRAIVAARESGQSDLSILRNILGTTGAGGFEQFQGAANFIRNFAPNLASQLESGGLSRFRELNTGLPGVDADTAQIIAAGRLDLLSEGVARGVTQALGGGARGITIDGQGLIEATKSDPLRVFIAGYGGLADRSKRFENAVTVSFDEDLIDTDALTAFVQQLIKVALVQLDR